MALLVSMEGNMITVQICGCVGKCSQIDQTMHKLMVEKFNLNKTTPITRLGLHLFFNRKYKLDAILKRYENKVLEYLKDPSNGDKFGLKLMQDIILDDLNKDPSWRTCNKCKKEYDENTRQFEEILYRTPNFEYCLEHC